MGEILLLKSEGRPVISIKLRVVQLFAVILIINQGLLPSAETHAYCTAKRKRGGTQIEIAIQERSQTH